MAATFAPRSCVSSEVPPRGPAPGATVGGQAVRKASVRDIAAATRAARVDAGAQRPPTARAKANATIARALAAGMRAGGLPKAAISVGTARVRLDLPRDLVERWMAKR